MIRAFYAHVLYWIGINVQVIPPVAKIDCLSKKRPPLSRFQSWRQKTSERLLALSNRITEEDRQRQHMHDVYENSMYLLMRGVSHDPHRKEPQL